MHMPPKISDNGAISQKQVLWGCLVCLVGALFYCYEFLLRIIPGALQSELSAALGHISASTFVQLSAIYYSSSLWIAGGGRFLVGFGSSFAFVGVLSLALHWLPRRYFSLVAGLITTLGMMGLVYGEVKITEMAGTMGLPYVLLLMVVLGALLTALIFLVVRDGPGGLQMRTQPLPDFFRNVSRVLVS